MPAQTACPIHDVDRALASYINCREDTLRIRRTLSKYLVSSLRPVNTATQSEHLNHECPQNLSAVNTNPPGLKGSRLEYLQALRAKTQAQARHRELQASLEELRNRHVDENPTQPESEYDNEIARGHVALLRQRRRFAELQVVQDSLDKLLSAKPSHTTLDPKVLVKDAIGEQPDLPAERLEQLSQAQNDQTHIFKLKQEVLEARACMERAQASREKAQNESREVPALQSQVYALERARDEIVEWVQGELAKLEEDSIFLEDGSPIKRPSNSTGPVDLAAAETQIRESYNQYTSSRASLIEAHISLQQPLQIQTDAEMQKASAPATGKARDTSKSIMPVTKLLPYLPHLTQSANIERSLLQQSVYLQTQIASADREIEEALLRLSGESHLLPAGTKDIPAWGKAAKEAEVATEESVREHLGAIRQEMSSVSAIVELCSLQSAVLMSTQENKK
ncbi:hypothetical protein BKA66DRAFT_468738 [Pyrenochaeta sp. MPI-SDFR-AT-0127]|nr:hypothetical protein BKA66DRAFT_468738 [Pyrenochaeta sp. MPI-SDFR-AT-0127]